MRNTKRLILCAIMCITSGLFSAYFSPVYASESNISEEAETQTQNNTENKRETESMSYAADTPNVAAPDDSVQKYASVAVISIFAILSVVWVKLWKKYGKEN